MSRKSSKSSTTNNNDVFQKNIEKWVDITQQIIDLEKKLDVLRTEQMNISRECVNITSSLTQEVKINNIVANSNTENTTSDSPLKNNSKKTVRRKRRTKAEIEKEKQETEKLKKQKEEEEAKNQRKKKYYLKTIQKIILKKIMLAIMIF